MKSDNKISEAVVRRLPVYLRFLNDLQKREIPTVSSQELGQNGNKRIYKTNSYASV